jgi:hypothetical protein
MGYFDKNNKFSMNVMKTICGDLKEADDQMVNLAQKSRRLAETLLYLHDTFGTNEDQSLKCNFPEMISMMGTATESCIRLLSDFKS